ncbi:unnamed protein product [Candidula unifasciata]|uniref:Ornithine decarboxylase n=1 Tax=Candidula unifasciata TaxID=100452 RepID=A0A8S3YNR2_9EUPU|nr:unnamed protein product [Candidula unifasciata]
MCKGNGDYHNLELYEGDVLPLESFLLKKVDMLESQNDNRPFFLVDLAELYRMLEQWRRHLPRVELFYALKCNPHPIVSRCLADAGVGFDCASKMEIEQILNLGVHPSRIIYANPYKPSGYLTYAAANNVDLMTFDSAHELTKIKKHYPNARLVLRIWTRNGPIMIHNLSKKFGCHTREVRAILAQAAKMNLNVVGVSFHVGGPVTSPDYYATAIEQAHRAFNIGLSLGLNMEIIDIGGGFPGKYNGYVTFEEVAESVNKSLDRYFPASEAVRIIAEPGHYFVTAAFTLTVSIIGKRIVSKRDIDDGCKKDHFKEHNSDETSNEEAKDESLIYMYVLDQGTCGAFANVTYDDADIQLKLLQNSNLKTSIVWGPTCATFDCVVAKRQLSEMEVGQRLYIPNMGAYSLSLATGFNGIELPLVFPVCSRYYCATVPLIFEQLLFSKVCLTPTAPKTHIKGLLL